MARAEPVAARQVETRGGPHRAVARRALLRAFRRALVGYRLREDAYVAHGDVPLCSLIAELGDVVTVVYEQVVWEDVVGNERAKSVKTGQGEMRGVDDLIDGLRGSGFRWRRSHRGMSGFDDVGSTGRLILVLRHSGIVTVRKARRFDEDADVFRLALIRD